MIVILVEQEAGVKIPIGRILYDLAYLDTLVFSVTAGVMT